MVGCKIKLAFICIAGLLVMVHGSDAAQYDDDPENEGKLHDLGEYELNVDDLNDEDAETAQASLDAGRQIRRRRRRRKFTVDRRRRYFVVDRRRRTHNNTRRRRHNNTRRRRSRRRRWGW